MARTLNEIYQQLVYEKVNQPSLAQLQPGIDDLQTLLSDINTPSRVANWRLWLFVVAVGIYVHEKLWDLFKAEVEDIAASAIPGTARWYRDQALLFQFGDSLQWINNKYQYAVIDPTKQIVKKAAVVEIGGQVRFKVAKLVGNIITPLNTTELNAFDAYIHQIKYAGTNTASLSRLPDILKVYYKVYYDPLVLSATGELLSNPGTYPVEDAINSHIGNLPFNGDLVLTSLTDSIQKAIGVVNPVLQDAQATYGALPYNVIIDSYNPDAGYLKIDPAFPLNTTITYIANV